MDRSKDLATFALATALTLVGTALLFALGWAVEPWFIERALAHAKETIPTLSEVVVSSPSELLVVRLELALSLALPLPVAWTGLLVRSLLAKRLPTRRRLMLAFTVPLPCVAAGLWLRTLYSTRLFAEASPADTGSMPLRIALDALMPGMWGLGFSLVLTSAIALLAFFATRRSAGVAKTPPARSDTRSGAADEAVHSRE